MQNVVRPTLVAMATKFGLGAEIHSPTGLYYLVTTWKQEGLPGKTVAMPQIYKWESSSLKDV